MTRSPAAGTTVDTMTDQTDSAPWDAPAVDLPERITPRWCAQTLTTPVGDAILRAHLEPASQDRRYRVAWERLWRMIAFDPRWRRTTIELLTADRADALAALDTGGLTNAQATPIRTYLHATTRALERLDREAAGPLAWASAGYAELPPRAREAIEALALSIDDYLNGEATGEDLRDVLAALDLTTEGREIPEQARARAREHRGRG